MKKFAFSSLFPFFIFSIFAQCPTASVLSDSARGGGNDSTVCGFGLETITYYRDDNS